MTDALTRLALAICLAWLLAGCATPAGGPTPTAAVPAAVPAPAATPDTWAPPASATTAPAPDGDAIALFAQYRIAPDQVGYLVTDPLTGRVLAAHRAGQGFIPASVAKLATTIVALGVLGPDHRFATVLSHTGAIVGGTITGDLFLVGGGDPMLDAADLGAFFTALRQRGVTRIAGRFVYDTSRLTTVEAIEPSQPEDAGYNPAVGALSLGFNRILLRWRRLKAGAGVVGEAVSHADRGEAPVPGFSLGLAPYDPESWQPFYYDGYYDGRTAGVLSGPRWLMSPRGRRRGKTWLPVKRPGAHTARVFRALAARQGIALPAPVPGRAPAEVTVLHRNQSAPLARIVGKVLEFSNNFAAEMIGLAATRKLAGKPLTLADSGAATAAWLRARIPEADWRGFRLANHSGLTTRSRFSPRQVAAILRYALGRQYGGWSYQTMLPFSGRAGPDQGGLIQLWAKSGTLDYVRGLAGLLRAEGGRELGFVFFVNDLAARRVYDANPRRRTPSVRARVHAWRRRAKGLEAALIRHWAARFGTTRPMAAAPGRVHDTTGRPGS